MKIEACKPKVNSVIDRFSKGVLKKDLESIIEILADDGEFEIQSPRLNTLSVNKRRFVSWFKKRLKEANEINISYDQCLHCSIGRKVLLINEGTFPRQIKDSSERSKTGLMLMVEEDRIFQIKFCYVFVKTENKFAFERKIDKVKHLEEQGYSFWQAWRIVENNTLLENKKNRLHNTDGFFLK